MNKTAGDILQPPSFCQYTGGACDQSFHGLPDRAAFFIYPSTPPLLAQTVRDAVRSLQQYSAQDNWITWEDLPISGQIIFCQICKVMRSSRLVVANITTLNFNVLFEIGYALGLGKPVLPVRDTTYEKDKKLFDEIGVFDALGYSDFANSVDLAGIVRSRRGIQPVVQQTPDRNRAQPIFHLRAPVESNGSIRIFSELKKSSCPFRTFDPRETPRLSLHEAIKQVHSSTAVVAHLMDPERTGATAHNARCAFVCGLAMAAEKFVLMLQEGGVSHPIDYRDVVVPYEDTSVIPIAISKIVRATAELVYNAPIISTKRDEKLLEHLDLGDVAAENEIQALSSLYFIKTPQFIQARQGHARLVIGRKGAGKTALFYGLRKAVSGGRGKIILDLKPEGHQFVKLREVVLARLSEGVQQHTLTAFWQYLLVLEVARKVIEREALTAWRDPEALQDFNELKRQYEAHAADGMEGDFSERLMALVNRLVDSVAGKPDESLTATSLTAMIYKGDISVLTEIVIKRQAASGDLWVLFDNIDKGFPTHGLTKEDVLIVRGLLDASRKLQRELQKNKVDCNSVVFIRRDVYDLLVENTPDRGKESHVDLDWSDEELMKELILRRIQASAPEMKGSFADVWNRLFDPHVGGESSFRYILHRTLLRPRDLLNFVRKAVQVAASRARDRVREEDICIAEGEYSEDMFNELKYELRDIYPQYSEMLPGFLGGEMVLSREDLYLLAMSASIPENRWPDVVEALLWFCFLGVRQESDDVYAYQIGYSHDRLAALLRSIGNSEKRFIVHPAFRKALRMEDKQR